MANDPEPSVTANHKRYKLIQPAWSTIYTYVPDSSPNHKKVPPLFVVEVSNWAPNKPHHVLHLGPDKTPPAVACSWLISTSRTSKIGLGDMMTYPDHVQWEDFKQENFRGSEFSWGMDLHSGRENLKWKRTAHHAVDGKKASHWSAGHWKLVRKEDNNRILCVITGEAKLSTICGILQFNVDWGKEFEYMVLLTVAFL